MSKTEDNLAAAFAGESQANRKYLAFAAKAENEGHAGLAKIFRVAAEGETVHAFRHLGALAGVKETAENLKSAIAGETYEIETMYPQFIAEIEEGETAAKMSFTNAEKVEEIHQGMFQTALSKLEAGEEILDPDYYVCGVCGYPAEGEAPEVCPICGAPKGMFKKV
ncbi:MAG: rubrerythrin family protein [Parcubacteria group bacterium]